MEELKEKQGRIRGAVDSGDLKSGYELRLSLRWLNLILFYSLSAVMTTGDEQNSQVGPSNKSGGSSDPKPRNRKAKR